MIVKCKHCGRQNKLPTTGKAEDYETKIFKCSSCKKPLFSKAEVAKYNPRPIKTRATPAKPVPPKPKPETYKSSSDPMTDKKIKELEEEISELHSYNWEQRNAAKNKIRQEEKQAVLRREKFEYSTKFALILFFVYLGFTMLHGDGWSTYHFYVLGTFSYFYFTNTDNPWGI